MAIVEVSDDEFQAAVLAANQPVLVDFWGPKCGPCKMMAPVLEDLALDLEGAVTVVKVNADLNPATVARYGVRGLPTLILFKQGAPAATKVGPGPKSQLRAFVDGAL